MKQTAKELLKSLSVEELENKVREGAEQMFRLKFQMSMGQGEGLNKYRELRKERAVLLTIRREKGVSSPVVMSLAKGVLSAKGAAKKTAAKKTAAKTAKPKAKKA
jgi:large subunit ribosomal protein L29